MASGTGHCEVTKDEFKLKCIGTAWFLDIGGKLKRMNILDNAQNVCIKNNVIFAGDKLYQVFTGDSSDIFVSEIEDVRLTAKNEHKSKENTATSDTIKDIYKNDNGESSASPELSHKNVERRGDSDIDSEFEHVHKTTIIERGKQSNSSSPDSLSTFRSDNSENFASAEKALNNGANNQWTKVSFNEANLYAFVTKPDRERGSISDSDADDDLEKGHEEYIAKPGILRGIFTRIKKAVKRKTEEKQLKTLYKKEESIYDNEKEIASPSISSEIYEDVLHNYTNINEVPGTTLVTALYDFKAFLDDEISFKQSDRFKLNEEDKSSNSDWCLAEHLKTGKKGYIPRAFVTNDMSSLEIKEWWFNVERYAAEQLLFSGSLRPGTFLVRPSNGMPMEANSCVLSVLCEDLSKGFRVAHYQIRQHLGRVYINRIKTFIGISELVDFYKAKAAGLACKLRRPVPKHSPIIYPRQMEVKRKCLGQLVPFEYGNDLKLRSGKFFDIQDVTVARISTGKMTLEEFREAATLLYNCRDSKAKIVRMIAVCFDPVSHLIVLGETIYCTLKEYLNRKGRETYDFSVLIQYAAQVADGMAFLEKNNIVHGYLRASRVFVCYPYVVKIAHPKLNELISGEARNIKMQGDWKWTAPEAINDERNYSVKSDVWSYGVLLYELITLGEEPYNGLTSEEALSLLEKGGRPQRPYESPDRCPIAFYFTMLKCWHKHPGCRPTFDFLRELFLDFENIEPFEIGLKADVDEINLNKDGVITDVDPNYDVGWWIGTTPGGKRGMFPSSYVEVPEGSQGDSQPTHIESAERNVTLEQATNKAEDKQGCKFVCVKALYSYEADYENEIPLNKDDIITDVDPNVDANWWIGTTPGGKRGMFPSSYVEVPEGSQGDSQPTHIESTERNVMLEQATNKAEDKQGCRFSCVKALYSYEADYENEIPLNKDDIITDVDPNVDANWWIGTTPGGKRGMFPSSYVEVPEEQTELNIDSDEEWRPPSKKSYDGDEIFLNKDDVKTDVDPSEVDPYDEGTTPDGKRDIIPSNNEGMLEDALTVRALYDYDAINDDDLSFRKGDKLEVDEEARRVSNWWVAKHLKTGAKGYVPSNYVTKDDNFLQAQELEILQDCDLSVTASGNKNTEYELN